MANQETVRRIALALPGVVEERARFAFFVEAKGKHAHLVWLWRERVDPKKPKVPNPKVVVVPVANEDAKDALIAGDPDVFFTEPHYNGYAAVLVRLPAIATPLLRSIVEDAWRLQAPPDLVEAARSKSPPASKRRSRPRSRPRSKPRPRRARRISGSRGVRAILAS